MKIFIDLIFNDHIIDARCIQVLKPKGQVATLRLDLTRCINEQITRTVRYEEKKKATRKKLDKNEN